jgi:hypothetical protein
MSRVKLLFLLLVLSIAVLWPVPAAAQEPDPNDCLPACYAYNKAPAGGNGTEQFPWDTTDVGTLRQKMGNAIKGKLNHGSLLVTNCDDAQPPNCTAVLYTYLRDGSETSRDVGAVPVPDVGVSLPFPHILSSIALLGMLLLGAGVVLRRRVRPLKS